MEYFERGSEWRKWDLHLHTPSSFDYEDKSITNEEIIETLKSKEVSAAVITDHHYIDVERIHELSELGKQNNILILPGIEIRSELGGSEKVHFIGIFPIENIDHVWTRIQGELHLTDHDIETCGYERIYKDLADSCEIFHELGGITTVHAGTKTNSIENIKNYFLQKQQQKVDLLKNSIDILEIGKEENIEDYENIVFKNIGFKTPLVLGSDNHNSNNYTLKQNCWIKADLSFEGLKQIIFEPEERVKIQETCPDEKNPYEVIESVKFLDDDFINSEIVLNSNLVSIIGGRSTGKSIFLRSVARAIDENHVIAACDDISNLINPNTVVKWKNGTEDNTETINSSEVYSEKKIRYIPQNFLNKESEKVSDSFSNELIKGILKSDDNYSERFSKIDVLKNNFEKDMHIKITELFESENKLNDLKNQQKELGSPGEIEQQIKLLNDEYDSCQNKDEASHEEIELQQRLVNELSDLKKELGIIENDKNLLIEFMEHLKQQTSFLDTSILNDLSESTKSETFSKISIADTAYKKYLVTFVEKLIDDTRTTIDSHQTEIKSKNDKLDELNNKINSSEKAKDIFKKIETEKERYSAVEEKIEEIGEIENEYRNNLNDIFIFYNDFIEKFKSESNSFSFNSPEYSNFEAELIFNNDKFKNTLKNSLNNQKFSAFERDHDIDLLNYEYNTNEFQKDLEIIIRAILNDFLITKSGKTKKDVLKDLLGTYHFINFNIIEDGDKLENMSPGKRSFALLKVLIESDKSKWPILIDQPEDDLDANSISKSLATFLREKKKTRQIIIVSHNPNLVVGADSEQVIIANQKGSDSKNKSKKFEYVTGSIENTYSNEDESCYLYCKGIKEHICDILEGGEESFKKRQNKYNIE